MAVDVQKSAGSGPGRRPEPVEAGVPFARIRVIAAIICILIALAVIAYRGFLQAALPRQRRCARVILKAEEQHIMQTTFITETRGPGLYPMTRDVAHWVSGGPKDGLLTLFIRHTSCSLLIQENADPEVQTDLVAWLGRFVPDANAPEMSYLRHRDEGQVELRLDMKCVVLG